jgi:hypothetical protein
LLAGDAFCCISHRQQWIFYENVIEDEMKNIIGIGITICMMTLTTPTFAQMQRFGTAVDLAVLTPVSRIVAAPDQFLDKQVTVQGRIHSVCSNKGCWMQLESDQASQQFKIKVRDGDMVFPVSARGKTAFATGKLHKTVLDLESSREHLADIAQRQQKSFDPASVTQPLVLLQLVPTGVEIRP